MRKNIPKTPLLKILRGLTPPQRTEFAKLAGTSVSYIYQLAGCNRTSCRTVLTRGLAEASVVMAKKYGTPVVTMQELAAMCDLPDLMG